MTARTHGRIADIEILRAVAIICVLIEHSFFNLVFDEAWLAHFLAHVPLWCGVDLFFAISGFVVTRQLLPMFAQTLPAARVLPRFWIARAFRLWPAAWGWLALIVAGSVIFVQPAILGTLTLNLAGARAGVLGFANFRFAHGFLQPYGASYPYWSLSLEEQFYVLLPVLMLIAGRFLVPILAALLLIQFPLPHPRLYFFLRNDGLLWGVLLAACPALLMLAASFCGVIRRVPAGGWIVLFSLLYVMTQLSPPFEQSPGFLLGSLAVCAAILVAYAAADMDIFHAGPLQPVLLWFGSRSYALYLCHVPIYQCSAAWSHSLPTVDPIFRGHIDARSCAICLILLPSAAELTRRLLEEPLRRTGRRLAHAI